MAKHKTRAADPATEMERFGRELSPEERQAAAVGVADHDFVEDEPPPEDAEPADFDPGAKCHKVTLVHCCNAVVEHLEGTRYRVQVVDLPVGADPQKPVEVDVARADPKEILVDDPEPVRAFRMACGIGKSTERPIACSPLPD